MSTPKSVVLGMLRHVLTGLGITIVQQGWADQGSMDVIIGAVVTVVGLVWSGLEKRGR